jgi:hypothetical protein
MRVYDRNLTGAAAAETSRTETHGPDRADGRSRNVAAGDGDRVELSGSFERISRAVASDASGRAEKVQQIASQYESGRYQADSVATSRALVNETIASSVQ